MSGRVRLLKCPAGDVLPDALGAALRDAGISVAWVRATGVVGDVELRTLKADGGAMERRFSGPLQIVSLDGTIGAKSALGLGVVLSRETDRGLETVAGTLTRARVVMLEALAVEIDSETRSALTGEITGSPAPPAVAISMPSPQAPAAQAATSVGATLPQRPARPPVDDTPDGPFPDAGDVVEHFAFGTCDVLKSDGDRIHLRVHRDQRIKEIAPEMLRVVPLDLTSSPRRFRLERKL